MYRRCIWSKRRIADGQLRITEAPLWALGRLKSRLEMARDLTRDERARELLDAAIREADEAQRIIAAWDGYHYRRR
ncbi:MAG: hypothetical protein H5T69_04150 [Chloroflexi bacterium]|nr:hypothetical protein [Chloroflexota bacterium]